MVPRSAQPTDGCTRRGFLRNGLLALATGVTTSTTGCLSSLPPLGRQQTYGRLDVPRAADPTYRRWLPAPSTNDDHYTFAYGEPSSIDGNEPEEFLGRRALSKTNFDYFGIGYEAFDSFLQTDFGTVIEAEFDTSVVAKTLTRSGYEAAGSYRGYDVFARSDVPRRAAVRDGTIVWSSSTVHEQPDIRALIDTETGERQPYHRVSADFERISDAVGASRMVIIGPDFGDMTDTAELGADAFRFTDTAVYQVIKLLFPDERVPTVDQLEEAYRNAHGWTDEADVFDVQVEDRLASLEARVPEQRSRDLSPLLDPPQVTWGVSHDAGAETLTVHHEAGETVDGDLLWYDIDTESAPGEVEKKPLWDGVREVTPGDSDTIDLSGRTNPIHVNVLLSDTRGCCGFRRLFTYELG